MTERHEPTPEFVSHLEWQVQTALRRQSRFSEPVPTPPRNTTGLRRMNTLLTIGLSAFIGAGAVIAKDEVQQSRAQEVLLVRNQGQQQIAGIQLQMAMTHLEDLQRRVDLGVLEPRHLLEGEVAVRESETHLMTLRLDEEEIRASGRAPRDEISAPLVEGRDFVTERLRLRLNLAQIRFSVHEERLSQASERVRLGVLHPETEENVDRVLMEAEAQIESLVEEMVLRQRFLEGELSAGEVERTLERRRTEADLRRMELTYDRISRELDRMEERVALGLLPQSEQERMELNLLQVGLELETLRRTLELLEEGGRG